MGPSCTSYAHSARGHGKGDRRIKKCIMYSYVILVHHCGHVGDIDGSCHAADGEGSGKPEELHNVINEWIRMNG